MNDFTTRSDTEFCWDVIGVAGDGTCSELSSVNHCRNCPVYSAVGRQLLERSIPENYRYERTQLLAESRVGGWKPMMLSEASHLQSDASPTIKNLTVVIFRLQQEWFALSAQVFKEATLSSGIHTIPYRSNQILRGLVSIRGELQLCISLSHLLNLKAADTPPQMLSLVVYPRMVMIEKAGDVWVFAVDELYGVHRFQQDELQDAPKSVSQTTQIYTKGLFYWRSCSVSYLDDELLFTALGRKILS